MPRFDDVIELIDTTLRDAVSKALSEVTIVRDVTGSATVVLPDDALGDESQWDAVAARLQNALGCYGPGEDQVLLRQRDLISPEDVLGSQDRIRLPERPHIFLVDRLLTNQDWLRPPLVTDAPLPTAVAFSIKGGVGRSTAFAALAWHLARMGKRVLVVDLDLEAPGIGGILLDALPDFGAVDWFVEALAGQADANLFEEMLMQSPLMAETAGSMHVIPAFGAKTREYVAKLGRAYTPSMAADGVMHGFSHRLAALVKQAAERQEPPDVVLLDARAGLHDIGAAAVTQVGAQVFVFGRDERPSWDAYERLFEHLRMARTVQWGMPEDDLRWRFKMVAAQLDGTEGALEHWVDASYACWSKLYDDESSERDETTAQTFDRNDLDAPHHPLAISFDTRMRSMNLVADGKRPEWSTVDGIFGGFLRGATRRLFSTQESNE